MGNVLVKIRKATIRDCRDIFRWRNDPETRIYSFHSSLISWEKHLGWYRNALQGKKKILYIGEDKNGSKIGVIRFDKINSRVHEVNIHIPPEKRGKGLGGMFLREASKLIKGRIIAKIKAENLISIRIFLKSGYKKIREKDSIVEMEYISY